MAEQERPENIKEFATLIVSALKDTKVELEKLDRKLDLVDERGKVLAERVNNDEDYTVPEDPSKLTRQALLREVAALKELVFTRLDGMDKAIELFNDNITRVPTDTDKQISHLKELQEKTLEEKFFSIQTQFAERDARFEQTRSDNKDSIAAALQAAKNAGAAVDEKIAHLEALHGEKFASIEKQFAERDTRTEQTSREAKEGIQAALQAAEKAVGKTEVNFTKQLDQLQAMIQQAKSEIYASIDPLKERLTRSEGKEVGQTAAKDVQQTSSSNVVAIIAVLVAAVIGGTGLLVALLK